MVQIGFVFVRQIGAPRFESFFNQIIAGLEDVLSTSSSVLIVKGVDDQQQEMAVYRHWHETRAVDAVVVKDLLLNDDRIEQLQAFGMPFVALGDVTQTGSFSAVRIDNGRAMRESMAFLIDHGHDYIARVAGPSRLVHTKIRTDVFLAEAATAGVGQKVVAGDFSQNSGERATTALLTADRRPTAIVYDNDLMALGGLAAAHALGIDVPGEVSLLAWDDSVSCQLARPALSALSHDVHQIGVQLAESLVRMLATGAIISETASQPVIVERGSTANRPAAHSPATAPVAERDTIAAAAVGGTRLPAG